jgi:hypothetical protein
MPEYWSLVNDPAQALELAYKLPEPWSPWVLDALERAMTGFRQKNLPMSEARTAALLYRYGRSSGRQVLLKNLSLKIDNERTLVLSMTAALIFALNREPQMAGPVIQAVQRMASSNMEEYSPAESLELPRALGDWKDPRVTPVLSHLLKLSPENVNIIIALSHQGATSQAPVMWKYYNDTAMGEPAKLLAAASLIRLKSKETTRLMAVIQKHITPDYMRTMSEEIIEALRESDNSQAALVLTMFIQKYVDGRLTHSFTRFCAVRSQHTN